MRGLNRLRAAIEYSFVGISEKPSKPKKVPPVMAKCLCRLLAAESKPKETACEAPKGELMSPPRSPQASHFIRPTQPALLQTYFNEKSFGGALKFGEVESWRH
jgi:hypothetical protein